MRKQYTTFYSPLVFRFRIPEFLSTCLLMAMVSCKLPPSAAQRNNKHSAHPHWPGHKFVDGAGIRRPVFPCGSQQPVAPVAHTWNLIRTELWHGRYHEWYFCCSEQRDPLCHCRRRRFSLPVRRRRRGRRVRCRELRQPCRLCRWHHPDHCCRWLRRPVGRPDRRLRFGWFGNYKWQR